MSQTKREIQVGVTVIVALTVLVAGTLWFKSFRFAGGVTRYAADFPAVEGLQVRDRVLVRGIRKGAVDAFEIIDDFVRVTFNVDKDTPLREDAKIQLLTVGIVGEMIVDINPGVGAVVSEGHVFQGQVAISLTAMSEAASGAMGDLRDLAGELHELVVEIRAEDRIPRTLNAAESTVSGMDTLLRENRENIRDLVDNFRITSDALREALTGPDSSLVLTVRTAARALTRADSVMINLEHTSQTLTEVVERMYSGQGTAGRLLADDALYARAESTLTAAQELLDDVRRNPKKYFKFNFIDF